MGGAGPIGLRIHQMSGHTGICTGWVGVEKQGLVTNLNNCSHSRPYKGGDTRMMLNCHINNCGIFVDVP